VYKNKRLGLTLQTGLSCICSTPELPERNFCDIFEMKPVSPLGGMHQAGAPETDAKALHIVFICVITSD